MCLLHVNRPVSLPDKRHRPRIVVFSLERYPALFHALMYGRAGIAQRRKLFLCSIAGLMIFKYRVPMGQGVAAISCHCHRTLDMYCYIYIYIYIYICQYCYQ